MLLKKSGGKCKTGLIDISALKKTFEKQTNFNSGQAIVEQIKHEAEKKTNWTPNNLLKSDPAKTYTTGKEPSYKTISKNTDNCFPMMNRQRKF